MRAKEKGKGRSLLRNLRFCLASTRQCAPLLLPLCALSAACSASTALLNTFLPRAAIDAILRGNARTLLLCVLAFTLPLALLGCAGGFLEKYIYFCKFRMNAYYLRRVAHKGLTADYCSQEEDAFRQLQAECFQSCNGNFSPFTQVYGVLTDMLLSSVGLCVYFALLAQLNPWLVLYLLATGAGKTTLAKLICGLIDPTQGEVCYGGANVKEYNRESYYRLFSAVFQEHSLLPVRLAEIVSACAPEETDAARVEACLRRAGLWEKIAALLQGMDSQFGRAIFDDGVEFSGGEVQKLLFARALYRDAPFVLLDEPTAALDPLAESRLYQTYAETMRGKSALFISHRLASTRFCDRILLLENGAIVEEGTHESLLKMGGRYAQLFETQARWYRDPPAGEEGAP